MGARGLKRAARHDVEVRLGRAPQGARGLKSDLVLHDEHSDFIAPYAERVD